MVMRLKTSADTEAKLAELDRKLKLSSKAAVMRIAIACSLKLKGDPRAAYGETACYDVGKQGGSDYQRITVFGRDEKLYRILMTDHLGRIVNDEEFFPDLTNAHIQRGIDFLYSEYRYADDKDKFFMNLIDLGR